MRYSNQTQLMVRCPNWFTVTLYSLYLTHQISFSVESSSSPHRQWPFNASPQLCLYHFSFQIIQDKALSLCCFITAQDSCHNFWRSARGFCTQDCAQRRARAQTRYTQAPDDHICGNQRARSSPPVVKILSESICNVRFEVLHNAIISTSSVWLSRSHNNLVLVDCSCSHLRDSEINHNNQTTKIISTIIPCIIFITSTFNYKSIYTSSSRLSILIWCPHQKWVILFLSCNWSSFFIARKICLPT